MSLFKRVLHISGLRSLSHVFVPVTNYMNVCNSPDSSCCSIGILLPRFLPALLLQQDLREGGSESDGKNR